MISSTGRPWLDELARAVEQFLTVLASAEEQPGAFASPVAACPGWDLRDLALHLGQTHLWTAGILGGADPRQHPQDEPAAGEPLAEWYTAQAQTLHRALTEAGPEKPCWTLVKEPLVEEHRTALFWQRRQVHETVVHLWDAQHALGRELVIDPALAFGGVAEVRDVMYPRMLRAGRVEPLPVSLSFTAVDVPADPVVIGEAERCLQLRAPAQELLLLVWHRIPWSPEYGDPEAAAVIKRSLVP